MGGEAGFISEKEEFLEDRSEKKFLSIPCPEKMWSDRPIKSANDDDDDFWQEEEFVPSHHLPFFSPCVGAPEKPNPPGAPGPDGKLMEKSRFVLLHLSESCCRGRKRGGIIRPDLPILFFHDKICNTVNLVPFLLKPYVLELV